MPRPMQRRPELRGEATVQAKEARSVEEKATVQPKRGQIYKVRSDLSWRSHDPSKGGQIYLGEAMTQPKEARSVLEKPRPNEERLDLSRRGNGPIKLTLDDSFRLQRHRLLP